MVEVSVNLYDPNNTNDLSIDLSTIFFKTSIERIYKISFLKLMMMECCRFLVFFCLLKSAKLL